MGNGVCKHLKGNICDIYDRRPDVCRVDVMYEKYFSAVYSRKEFYRLNELVCEELFLQSDSLAKGEKQ